MSMLVDEEQRQQALDIGQSYIVQAPAGSGKTEILTQRFLVLLARATRQPEEVLAITFTRKAASEMRQRIIETLQLADKADWSCVPAHRQKSVRLAHEVLQQSHALQWSLLRNPNRLNIQTIDALCASLTKRLPVLSGLGTGFSVTEHAHSLYKRAAEQTCACIVEQSEWSDVVNRLLAHFDNRQDVLCALLIEMLAQRDQWLPICLEGQQAAAKQRLEHNLTLVIDELIAQAVAHLLPYQRILMAVLPHIAQNCDAGDGHAGIRIWSDCTTWPKATHQQQAYWQSLADWLLTSQDTLRTKMDKRQGVLAATQTKNKEEKQARLQIKQDIKQLLDALATDDQAIEYLIRLKYCPENHYTDAQWVTLSALLVVLSLASAQLQLCFRESREIDFLAVAQAALTALGDDEQPTDMALALDYRLSHLLVDEFQDTSLTQYHLLTKLIAGWTPGDGRTLFFVGDPMQSIYRFRQAEVGLFMRAQQEGIGHVPLIALNLRANFRCDTALVNWFNDKFPSLFPRVDEITRSRVSYHPSEAVISGDNCGVYMHEASPGAQEAEAICKQVYQTLTQYPNEHIAILVRSRNHLREICPRLDRAEIAYQAVDIAPLALNAAVQDCLSLTRALNDLGDRLAWLSILRAPWCGLCLADCHHIAQDASILIWRRLCQPEIIAELSVEGQYAWSRCYPVFCAAMRDVGRVPLRELVERAWYQLAAPSYLSSTEMQACAQYFCMLDACLLQHGRLILSDVMQRFNQAYRRTNVQDAQVHVMTIHKAKGLEFDTVIIPGIGRKAVSDQAKLLNWLEMTTQLGQTVWLMATHPVRQDKTRLFQFISRLEKEKSRQETIRQLYVAMTRAKKRCHLFYSLKQSQPSGERSPEPGSFLSHLWSVVTPSDIVQTERCSVPDNTGGNAEGYLNHLPYHWQRPTHIERFVHNTPPQSNNPVEPTAYQWQSPKDKCMGTIIHRLLFDIAEWQMLHDSCPDDSILTHRIQQLIHHFGLPVPDISEARTELSAIINGVMQCPQGQWILRRHKDAMNEYRILYNEGMKQRTLIIDRCFVDSTGLRWLIDYKYQTQVHAARDAFVETALKTHHQQMSRYCHALATMRKPIDKAALYYPATGQFCQYGIDALQLRCASLCE